MSRIDTNASFQGARASSPVNRLVTLAKSGDLAGVFQFVRRWLLYKAHYHLYDKWFERFEAFPTSKGVRAVDLDFDDALRRHSVEYLAAPRLLVHKAIRLIPHSLNDLTFIDIGSGLGRPLLVAAEYPFKAAVGYELSPSLHRGAVANLEQTLEAAGMLCSVESVNANALEANWPEGSRAFFLFNPFDREFMERFLHRICTTAAPGAHQYMLFLNLKNPELLSQFPFEQCQTSLLGKATWALVSPYPLLVFRYIAPQGVSSAVGAAEATR
jgi:hypothetical protein